MCWCSDITSAALASSSPQRATCHCSRQRGLLSKRSGQSRYHMSVSLTREEPLAQHEMSTRGVPTFLRFTSLTEHKSRPHHSHHFTLSKPSRHFCCYTSISNTTTHHSKSHLSFYIHNLTLPLHCHVALHAALPHRLHCAACVHWRPA
jgi:hypothetical protein